MSELVVDHEVILIWGPHPVLALFRTLSNSSNTIRFMGWWPLFQKSCLFLAQRHEYSRQIEHVRGEVQQGYFIFVNFFERVCIYNIYL